MTEGQYGQQNDQTQGSGQEFQPKPGQPTMPFRAIPPGAPGGPGQPQQGPAQSGYGYPQQGQEGQPSGYGYPQQGQPSGYGYPQQGQQGQPSGYGYPQQQHGGQGDPDQSAGPAWTPPSSHIGEGGLSGGGGSGTPDWSAMADRGARDEKRRRKLFLVGGGSLAVVVIAAIVATAVVVSGHHKHPVALPTATPTPVEPTPSFSDVTPPPAPNPLAVLSSKAKDTRPITTAAFFAGRDVKFTAQRHYLKAGTASTTSCASAASSALGAVLAEDGCRKLLRATYYGNGVAVTVGIAVFDDKAHADEAAKQAGPYVLPLSGSGVAPFCHGVACQTSVNSLGRYAYFTIAGHTDDSTVTATDPTTVQAREDIAFLAFETIKGRGEAEAATSAPD